IRTSESWMPQLSSVIQKQAIMIYGPARKHMMKHISRGAVFADILNDLSDPEAKYALTVPSREYFTDKISKLGIGDPDTYAVVYDRGAEVGNSIASADWASRLAWQIRYEGFENVAVTCIRFFTAFIRLWIKAVDNDDIIIMKCLFNIFFCGKERIISLAGEFSLGVGVYFIGYGLVF